MGDVKTYEGVSLKRFEAAQDRILIKLIRYKKDLERLNDGIADMVEHLQTEILVLEGKVSTLEQWMEKKKGK